MLRPDGGAAQLDAEFLAALVQKGKRAVRDKVVAEGSPPGSVPNELLPADAGRYLKARKDCMRFLIGDHASLCPAVALRADACQDRQQLHCTICAQDVLHV